MANILTHHIQYKESQVTKLVVALLRLDAHLKKDSQPIGMALDLFLTENIMCLSVASFFNVAQHYLVRDMSQVDLLV